jgi:hypothetical protein
MAACHVMTGALSCGTYFRDCRIRPVGGYRVSRRYLSYTLVLEIVFKNEDAEAGLLDCITMREVGEHYPHLNRAGSRRN